MRVSTGLNGTRASQPARQVDGESPGHAQHHKTTRRRCAVREPADPRAPASQAGYRATATALGSRLVACARRPAYDHSLRLAGAVRSASL